MTVKIDAIRFAGNMESHAMSMGIKAKDNGDDINQSTRVFQQEAHT